MSSVLIISNNSKKSGLIAEKVKLLRECDNIEQASYIEAISALNAAPPSMIIVYGLNNDAVSIVKEIRTVKYLDKVPVVLAMEEFNEDLLLYAFDNGIDDFFFMNDSDTVILMRILLTLQKTILYKQIEVSNDILSASGIVEKRSGIYTKEKAPDIMKRFFGASLEENLENTVFMCVKPMPLPNKKLNMHAVMTGIASIVRKVPRGNDIIAYGRDNSFYLILYSSGFAGAKSVAARMKHVLFNTCRIYADAAEITASFEETEPVLMQSLNDQIEAGLEFNYLKDLNISEASENMHITDESGKSFKEFKKEFYEAFEKITSPVFYHMKKTALAAYPNAKVSFDLTEGESRFEISQENMTGGLVMTYPAYTKLIIDIRHSTGAKRPQIKRMSIDFEEFSSDKLISILQDLINEFGKRLNKERQNDENTSE